MMKPTAMFYRWTCLRLRTCIPNYTAARHPPCQGQAVKKKGRHVASIMEVKQAYTVYITDRDVVAPCSARGKTSEKAVTGSNPTHHESWMGLKG